MTSDHPAPESAGSQESFASDEEYQVSEPDAVPPAQPFAGLAERSSPERLIPNDDDKFRYSIADVMILTFGISLGMAGGTWIHPGIFSLLLGVTMLAGLTIFHIHPPETHRMKVVWITLVVGYLSSVIAAMIKFSPVFE